jgi:hypothetical protein
MPLKSVENGRQHESCIFRANNDLRMLRNLWEESGDAEGAASLSHYHYSIEHFEKNSYNMMMVYLIVQMTSMTMLRMI